MTVRKQFMTRSLTKTMKGALNAGLAMGRRRTFAWRPGDNAYLNQLDDMRFLTKLCVLDFASMPAESSLIHKFFESDKISSRPGNMYLVQQQTLNLLEQALEQKEPIDCVKRLESTEETERKDSEVGRLPRFRLHKKFIWERSKDVGCNEELVFIARIPIAPKTTRLSCCATYSTDSGKKLFVIFFKKRESGLDNLETPIDGKLFAGTFNCIFDVEVKPEYEACFLYFVPGDATRMELMHVDVDLWIVLDGQNRHLCDWLEVLLRGRYGGFYQLLFSIFLLRDGALALLGPNTEQHTELKDAFDMEGLDTTQEGLECIVAVCNVLLQPRLTK